MSRRMGSTTSPEDGATGLRAAEGRFPIGSKISRRKDAGRHNAGIAEEIVAAVVVCGVFQDVWLKTPSGKLLDPEKYELRQPTGATQAP